MNDNLLVVLQQMLDGDFSRRASEYLDESQGSMQSALGLLLPAVLGAVVRKGATPEGAASLSSLLEGADLDAGSLGNLDVLFGGGGAGMSALSQSGEGNLVAQLFGNRGGALADALASASGVDGSSANRLLAMVVPLVLAFLKKLIADKGLNANSLSSLLAAQGPHVKEALDSRLAGALGFPAAGAFLGGVGGHDSGATAGAVASGSAMAATNARNSGQARWLPWVIVAALAFMLWNLFAGKPAETPMTDPAIVDAPALESEPEDFSAALPASIYFDVGSATVSADGYSTIAAVANIVNRGGLNVAVIGYTDQSGDIAMNEELARYRVQAVVDALQAEGVAESAIEMQPPLYVEAGASEGTDAEARRVDINLQ